MRSDGFTVDGTRLRRSNPAPKPKQPRTRAGHRPALERPCTGLAPALVRMNQARFALSTHCHGLTALPLSRIPFAHLAAFHAARGRPEREAPPSRNVAHCGSKLFPCASAQRVKEDFCTTCCKCRFSRYDKKDETLTSGRSFRIGWSVVARVSDPSRASSRLDDGADQFHRCVRAARSRGLFAVRLRAF